MTRVFDWVRDVLSEFSGSLNPDAWSIFGINFAHPALLLLLLLPSLYKKWSVAFNHYRSQANVCLHMLP